MDVLWAPLRFRLSACIDRWNPKDPSALEMVRPWKLVFDSSNWEPLIGKILARMESALREVDVRPDGQDIEPIQNLIKWVDVAPNAGLAHVLDVALFPQWHTALRSWLRSSDCDFNEVLQWYQGWKALLPAPIIEVGVIQKHLANGLAVMKQFMSKGSAGVDEGPSPSPPPPPSSNKEDFHPCQPASTSNLSSDDISLSIQDYLAHVAGEEGLVFRPRRKELNGKQVYEFGAASVYLDKALVFASSRDQTSGAETWSPISMDELLRLARSASSRRKF